MYEALIALYNYQIKDAKATLQIYFESPVGIGEHPQHTQEMDKLLDIVASAEDRKYVLQRHFQIYETDKKEKGK